MSAKQKVAILGAGPGGLSAAFGLSATPELREKYDITIYQVGWRAGGKCSSGRAGPENRIEQNGTHYLFGCYDNTVQIARTVYGELKEEGVEEFGDFKTALLPRDLLALKHEFRGEWKLWPWPLPNNDAEPGVQTGFLRPVDYLSMFIQSILTFLFGINIGRALRPPSPYDKDRPLIIGALWDVFRPILALIGWVFWAIGLALVRLAADLMWLCGDPNFLFIAKLLSGIRRGNRFLFQKLARRYWLVFKLFTVMDFACTLGIALLRDKVPAEGLSAIEGKEFKAWLAEHGAAKLTLHAPFVTTWYDAVAAYEDGDPNRPNLSAGVSMMAINKAMLTYKGHFAYQMRSEIGDTFTGPVVAALKARGVKFCFFHRVRDVVPGQEDVIDEIVIEQQVSLKSGDPCSYDPFETVKGLKVWPNEPRWDQIEETPKKGVNLESYYTTWKGKVLPPLKRGKDFDHVVMAMPAASLPTYCAKLLDRSEKWRVMTEHMTGVESQTMRLYFTKSLDELGWNLPTPVLSAYALPFATWEDNGDLVTVETWPEGEAPKSIATLFGPLPAPKVPPPPEDSDYPARQDAIVFENATTYLEKYTGTLWPKAGQADNPAAIDWSLLIAPENDVGAERLAAQYVRANTGPLQRYTNAKAGTAQYRLAPDGSGFSNMVLAGDWTANHYLIGSIEGAIMSGFQASRALSGHPAVIPGEDTGL